MDRIRLIHLHPAETVLLKAAISYSYRLLINSVQRTGLTTELIGIPTVESWIMELWATGLRVVFVSGRTEVPSFISEGKKISHDYFSAVRDTPVHWELWIVDYGFRVEYI